jgi:cytochrome b subunit of formate dehydrogenase
MTDRPPWLPLLVGTLGLALGMVVHAAAADETAACLACHADKGRVIRFPEGTRIEAYVDERQFKASVHSFLACTDCHPRSLVAEGHEQQRFRSEETFKLRYSLICRRCHQDQEIAARPVHASLLAQEARGNAPVCTDCHPAHAIMPVTGGHILAEETRYCLGCHEELAEVPPLAATAAGAGAPAPRVHANLTCSGCHSGYSRLSHPGEGEVAADAPAPEQMCRRCHFDKYTKTLESIHYRLLSQGHPGTPTCIDCHGAHQVTSLRSDRARSAAKCGECHPKLYAVYATSVHGDALVNSNNQDVPICTDCHRAHDIGDPLTADYRDDIPFMCANCHARKAIAGKYGLTTDVVKTYLSDFHGSAISMYRDQDDGAYRPQKPIAVCTDCHGTHDIRSMSSMGSAEIKAMLLGKCRQCHEGASADFPDAWLSHYTASMSTAPVLFIVSRAYAIVLPLIIAGILLQVLLHARRYAAGHAYVVSSAEGPGAGGDVVRIRRFPPARIVEHLLLIVLFVVLASTGLAQEFHHLEVSQWLFAKLGGVDMARRVHHCAGLAFAAMLLLHVVIAVWGVTARGWPPSMLVSRQDVLDAIQDVRYALGVASKPADRGRYGYKEKFTYWLVLMGGLIMVLTGFILWFPVIAVRFLPGEAIPVAAVVHSQQALVVLLLASAWHVYDSIFSPDVFPLDTSIFTGYTSRASKAPRD